MKDKIEKIKNIFLYCGLTKEEYNSLKRDAYVNNFMIWKFLCVFLVIMAAVLSLASAVFDPASVAMKVCIAVLVYTSAMVYLFFQVLQPDSLVGQLMIYLTMILLMVSSLLVSVSQPQTVSVTFIVLLVTFPMFMIDYPFYMAILLSCSVAVYLLTEKICHVDGVVFRTDALNSIIFGLLGILINIFYNYLKVQEMSLFRSQKELAQKQEQVNGELGRLNVTLRKMSEGTVDLLGDIVESRDEESGEHIRRVKTYTYILAKKVMEELPEYGLDDYSVDLITFTSSLHDVGKISIPDAILNKPGKLTKEEFEIMKTHCEKGSAVIRKMEGKWSREYLDMGLDICLCHHEKWDGSGYPKGLIGDEIPIAAQIVSVADCYDALTTKRVYKDAYTPEKAFSMITGGECGAFSEKLMRCFDSCREDFEFYASGGEVDTGHLDFEYISRTNPEDSFVIGIHDQDRTLREKVRLSEEVSVLESLSEEFFYVCYVNMQTNEVVRFKADKRCARILNSYGDMKSNERFDKLLNSIILSEDFDEFRRSVHRETSTEELFRNGHKFVDFRIRLEDGIHYCRMKMSLSHTDKNAVIIGIVMRDKEHAEEESYLRM